jgi:hypothetical protein
LHPANQKVIDTVISPDDGHIVARNMYRKEIIILRKLCTKLALFTRLYKDAPSTKYKIPHLLFEITQIEIYRTGLM